jgi:acetyl esterase/lipase
MTLPAQTPLHLPPPDRIIPLYDGVAPGSEQWNWEERTFTTRRGNDVTQNVVHPTLEYYAPNPAKACGTAMIIAPGGGFTALMIRYEGRDIARRLQAMGVAAFILKYRLVYVDPAIPLPPPGPLPPPPPPRVGPQGEILSGPQQGQNIGELSTADGRQAIRWLRAHAGEFGVEPHRLGIMGFSAGGFVVLATATGPAEARPDFAAALYGPGDGHQAPAPDAPPLFLAAAADDAWATEGSLKLYAGWRAAKRPVELHLFQTGGHGFLNKGGGGDHFMDRLEEWMRANGWLKKSA